MGERAVSVRDWESFRAENGKNWCCIQLMFLWLEVKVEKKVMEA